MSDELKAAVELVEASLIPGSLLTPSAEVAAWTLAKAYLADLARREQDYAEHPDESIEKCLEFIECVPIEASRNPAVVAEWWGRYRALAKHVRAELVQREQEQAERAKPVTEEWLLANGWTSGEHGLVRTISGVRIVFSGDEWFIGGYCQTWHPTRGHVLDLLSALGAGKGGG